MNAHPRYGSWIITVPLAGLAVAYVMFVFLPGQRAIGQLREQANQKQDFITRAGAVAASMASGKQELGKAETFVTGFRKRLCREEELAALYSRIHELAEAARIRTTRFDPQPAGAYETFRRVPLSLGCSGPFPQVYEFLRNLEGLPQAIWIDSVRIDNAGDSGRDALCEINLAIFVDNPGVSGYAKHAD